MRRRLVLASVAALLVLGAAALLPGALDAGDARSGTLGSSGGSSGESSGGGLADVRVFEDLPTTHVEDEVDYETSPPAGGEHDETWLDCGSYDRPVREENAVHSLEHGTVWITYDPDLGADDVAVLEAALPEFGILSPYEGLPAPVVVTVWERQLELDGADDPRLGLFVDEYGDGGTAPETGVGCPGGDVVYDAGTAI